MGKYEVCFQKGVVKSAGYSLFSAILVFDSLDWYLGKHQKVMPIASECGVLLFNSYAAICRHWNLFSTYSRSKGDMASYNDPYCPRRWLLCSIFEPILQKVKTICCQQKRTSIHINVVLFYYHPVVTILSEPNFQGSLSSQTIFSSLNVPELGGHQVGPNSVNLTLNIPNPISFTTSVKAGVLDELQL
ncbi:bifunctional nitrilase/nitrile hydratase nit4b [Quercus suber]|uniref:Bifunctional nitrilase/nitrile hydratase nit4b n=1 Tax=Quercus suber TaxID=58331 RepID=A0AAW0LZW5_QUESU